MNEPQSYTQRTSWTFVCMKKKEEEEEEERGRRRRRRRKRRGKECFTNRPPRWGKKRNIKRKMTEKERRLSAEEEVKERKQHSLRGSQ